MPARINAEERRSHIIEAAFRKILAEGVEGITLRKVSAEAELNIGSVRHFFDGHEDLLEAAAREAGERMGRRLAPYLGSSLKGLKGEEALDSLQELLEQVLPMDEARRAEAIVVLEFIRASRVQPLFAPAAAQMGRDLHEVVVSAFFSLGVENPGMAARQITALIGGLTMDAVTPHGALSTDQVRAILRGALRHHLSA